MPRAKKFSPPGEAASENQLDGLTEAVEQLTEALSEVKQLTQEVRVLRDAIDDVRQELEWAVRNMPRPAWTPAPQLTSIPIDPLAEDFHERVNRYDPMDLADEPAEPTPADFPAGPITQGDLF